MKNIKITDKVFNPTNSQKSVLYIITTNNDIFQWSNYEEKIELIRNGLPYGAIEFLSYKAKVSNKTILTLLNITKTTYNRKKNNQDKLDTRDTEMVLMIAEILDYGVKVFNNETKKFQRWLKKPNISLGNTTPLGLFDSNTGINEVRNILNKIDSGNFV